MIQASENIPLAKAELHHLLALHNLCLYGLFPPDTGVACRGPAIPHYRRVVNEEVIVLWLEFFQNEASKSLSCAGHVIVHTLR